MPIVDVRACATCAVPVLWLRSFGFGDIRPVERTPVPHGDIVLDREQARYRFVQPGDPDMGAPRYRLHWPCPRDLATRPTPARPRRPRAVFVGHTHWDREWYLTQSSFQVKLADMVDEVLDVLDGDPAYTCFVLDGQTAMVDDFLAARPDAEPRVRRLARDGRLAVGPWETLADSLLVSGETLVRNLQRGMQRARDIGGLLRVGYLPDQFGQAAQIPQLLSLAGIRHALVFRGVPDAIDETAFWWQSPDGSRVRAEALPAGYCNGIRMPFHEVYGRAGTLAVGRGAVPLSCFDAASGECRTVDAGPPDEWGFVGLFRSVLPALVAGNPTVADGSVGRHVQAVVDAAYRSSASGRTEPVVVDAARDVVAVEPGGGVKVRPSPAVSPAVAPAVSPAPSLSPAVGEWDIRHLLLSVEERPRSRRDRAELAGVIRRTVSALSARPPRPVITVPVEFTGPDMLVEGLPQWVFETNSWIVAPDGPGGDCVVIDVPPSPERVVERLVSHRLRLAAVVATHGHLDHVGGSATLLAALGVEVPVYVHADDAERVLDLSVGGGALAAAVEHLPTPPAWEVLAMEDGDRIDIGSSSSCLVAFHTAGHTPGSTCLVLDGPTRPLLFTGDVLFAGGAGRGDLLGASPARIGESLAALAQSLLPETVILPGHGGITTLADELETNRLLKAALSRRHPVLSALDRSDGSGGHA